MGRRLEKYYLFCYTTFLSLFTMKFVRYIYIRQNTLQVGTKKPANYIVNFGYISEVYTLSRNKKRLQNMSEIFDMVHMNQVGNLAEVSRDFRDIIS